MKAQNQKLSWQVIGEQLGSGSIMVTRSVNKAAPPFAPKDAVDAIRRTKGKPKESKVLLNSSSLNSDLKRLNTNSSKELSTLGAGFQRP